MSALAAAVFFAAIISASCTQLKKPVPEPFFAETTPPPRQEFRWSNGKLPKSFDPAIAAAPPETDLVRALFEGLTEVDPVTLEVIPGAAQNWSSSQDDRVWTFNLRPSARWSDGRPVTAHDFVRAWGRLVRLGDKTAHRNLLRNFVGVIGPAAGSALSKEAEQILQEPTPTAPVSPPVQSLRTQPANTAAVPSADESRPLDRSRGVDDPEDAKSADVPGFEAKDDLTLIVRLRSPDPELPKLLSGTIFRPIAGNGSEFATEKLDPELITNGAFRIGEIGGAGIRLVRADHYWNKARIGLESVLVVQMDSPEAALEAYRAGDLDAITNIDFSPLVLKLLSPYDDFRKTTHSALNFYEINTAKAPFSDRRVREALTISIERERLTEGETEGSTRPALQFLPYRRDVRAKLAQDKTKAQDLLREAGFPDGDQFPVIRLLINRNDTQQRIGRSVARMWKQNLNVETEIIVKEPAELERLRRSGDFDLMRRGVVFPTSNNTANMTALFDAYPDAPQVQAPPDAASSETIGTPSPANSSNGSTPGPKTLPEQRASLISRDGVILSEDEALYELRAIPLYFPTSYALVKPYVSGFETNSLDVFLLNSVVIDSNWKPEGR